MMELTRWFVWVVRAMDSSGYLKVSFVKTIFYLIYTECDSTAFIAFYLKVYERHMLVATVCVNIAFINIASTRRGGQAGT